MEIVIPMTAAVTTALIAGLFFTSSVSIIPGLAELSDSEYIRPMQSINRAIQNVPFLLCFLGGAVLLPASAYLWYDNSGDTMFLLLIGASGFYLIGALGITVFGNIPLNNDMDSFDLNTPSDQEMANWRAAFTGRWNRYHHLRTAASLVAFALVLLSCVVVEI